MSNLEQTFLNDKQVAEIVGRGVQTLRNDRFHSRGLPYSKFGRLCKYRLADVLQFMEQNKVVPSAPPGG